jgi:hypothetical protein
MPKKHGKSRRADDKRGPGYGDNVKHVARHGSTGTAKPIAGIFNDRRDGNNGNNGKGKRAK